MTNTKKLNKKNIIKQFDWHLQKANNEYKLQQELLALLKEPTVSVEQLAHYKPLVESEHSKQLFQTLLDKYQFINDVKHYETKIDNELKHLKEQQKKESLSVDDTQKLREQIMAYENNPYRDIELLDTYTDELLDLEKPFLTSNLSKIYASGIETTSDLDYYKQKCNDGKFLSDQEITFLRSLITQKETQIKKRISAAAPINKEIAKKYDEFQTISDIENLEMIYKTYKASKYAELDVLNRASAFFVVLNDWRIPAIRLKAIGEFLNGKQRFTKRDIEKLKTMLDAIPLDAFDIFVMKKQQFEFYQFIYTHLAAELEVEREKKEADKGTVTSEIAVSLQSSQSASQTNSSSQSDRASLSVISKLRKQKTGNQKIRDLLLEQPLRGIPVILVAIHGGMRYKDGICMESFSSPLDVLFRMISTAPGETTTNTVHSFEYSNLLDNEVIRNPEKQIKDVLTERKENTALDKKINKFRALGKTGESVATNINFKSRNHLIINYKNTKICKKMYYRDASDIRMGVHVLNTTEHLQFGIDLVSYKPFLDFLNVSSVWIDTVDGIQYAYRFSNADVYNFLKHLGYKQAVILDGACESNMETKSPKFSTTSIDAIKKVQALINEDETTARNLVKITEKMIFRTDPSYKTHKEETKKIRNNALPKSKRHPATIAKDHRGIR